MENLKKEDVKKPEEAVAEVPKETLEEVGEKKVEKAEGFSGQFKGNDEKIEENLNGDNSPEAKKILSEEKDVMNEAGEKISGFENEVKNTDNKEKREAREKLLEEVFENSVGGIMTSFHDTGQVYKTYGEKIGYKKGFIINQFPVEDKEFKQNGINEAVTISPVSTEVYGEEEYTEGTIFKKKKKKRVETGMRDMNFDEMKKGGKNEKAYRFVYKTIDDEKAIYRDSSGRTGQYMFVELYLPESIALEILEEIKSEPKFVRELVEKLVKDEMKQNQWNGGKDSDGRERASLRPPYKKWAENKGGESKMYVQEPDANLSDGFNSKYVIDVEKGESRKEAKPEPVELKPEPENLNTRQEEPKIEKAINPNEQIKTINYWLTEAEKCTDMATAKSLLEVVEEELAIAKNANIDISQITNLEERIEKIKEKINSEKMEHIKPVDVAKEEINTEPVFPETEKIIPEPKSDEPSPKTETPETEKTAEDIGNEKLADEIEKEVNERNFDTETKERLNEWNSKSEEEKKEEIKEEKSRIEGELGNRIMAENANLIEQKNVKEILESRDELAALRKKLDEEVRESMDKNREISDKIKDGIDPNVDLSQLNISEQAMAKEAMNGFLKTTKDVLSVKEIDYLLEEMNNPENLLKTHGERKIEMEELQAIIDAIEEYKEFMKRFEEMTEEQREEVKEEVKKLVDWLEWVKKHKNKFYLVLIGLGIVGGILGIASLLGMAGSAAVPYATMENAILAAKVVGAGAAIYHRKKVWAGTKYIAGKGLGAAIGAGVVLDAMFDGKKWDGWMKKICGVNIPWGAESKKEK